MEKKKKLALFLACSASILQLVSAMQPLASVAYAAETAGSSTLTTGTEPTAVDQTAAVAYIGLIADAAQKATENNPIDASLLIGYSILYTDWGTTLGGQAGNYLPAVGQSGTQQTLADDFRIFADTFYSASKDSLDAAPDRETQSALLESYVKVPGIAQQLAALICTVQSSDVRSDGCSYGSSDCRNETGRSGADVGFKQHRGGARLRSCELHGYNL